MASVTSGLAIHALEAAILNTVVDGIILADAGLRIVFLNQGAEGLLGYASAEVIGQPLAVLLPPEIIAACQGHLVGLRSAETVARRQDGSEVPAEVTVARLTHEGALAFTATVRDLTRQKRQEEVLQDLARRLVAVQEEERLSLARELHDEAGQDLTALRLYVAALEEQAANPEWAAQLREMSQLLDQAGQGLRRVITNLRPAGLDQLGLVPAVRQYLETYGKLGQLTVALTVRGLGEERLAPEVETHLYRIIQECLTNVVRYAHASQASVLLSRQQDQVKIVVRDNGRGFDPNGPPPLGGRGLTGVRERAQALGGSAEIASRPGEGTTVTVIIPLPEPPAAPLAR